MRVRNARYNDSNTFVTNLRFQWLFLVAEISTTTTKITQPTQMGAERFCTGRSMVAQRTFRLRYGRDGCREVLSMFKTVA